MGSDRFHWDLVSDGDTTRADLAAVKVKLVEAERERDELRATMKRLEEWAVQLESKGRGTIDRRVADDLRRVLQGGSNG
jgi:hypothetical protein